MFLHNPTPGNIHNSRKCFWTLHCRACSRLCLMKVGSSCRLLHFDCFLTPFSVSEVYPLCPMWCRLLTITTACHSNLPILPRLGLWHSLQVKSSLQYKSCFARVLSHTAECPEKSPLDYIRESGCVMDLLVFSFIQRAGEDFSKMYSILLCFLT